MNSKLIPFERTANYYETDRMGIVHHSNFIRRFEEARVDYLNQAGFPYSKMEELGVMLPVQSLDCSYKNAVRFDETVLIEVKITEFNGFKMTIQYVVTGKENGDTRAIGTTRHLFVTKDMKPVRVKGSYPGIYELFRNNVTPASKL